MGYEATMYLLERGVRLTGIDGWSWDAPFVYTAKKFAETGNASLIWEGHKAGRHIGYCHIEKLHNLELLPPTGFTVSCFPVKVERASAGWTRAVAIIEDEAAASKPKDMSPSVSLSYHHAFALVVSHLRLRSWPPLFSASRPHLAAHFRKSAAFGERIHLERNSLYYNRKMLGPRRVPQLGEGPSCVSLTLQPSQACADDFPPSQVQPEVVTNSSNSPPRSSLPGFCLLGARAPLQ